MSKKKIPLFESVNLSTKAAFDKHTESGMKLEELKKFVENDLGVRFKKIHEATFDDLVIDELEVCATIKSYGAESCHYVDNGNGEQYIRAEVTVKYKSELSERFKCDWHNLSLSVDGHTHSFYKETSQGKIACWATNMSPKL